MRRAYRRAPVHVIDRPQWSAPLRLAAGDSPEAAQGARARKTDRPNFSPLVPPFQFLLSARRATCHPEMVSRADIRGGRPRSHRDSDNGIDCGWPAPGAGRIFRPLTRFGMPFMAQVGSSEANSHRGTL